jgi:hypothetical protein
MLFDLGIPGVPNDVEHYPGNVNYHLAVGWLERYERGCFDPADPAYEDLMEPEVSLWKVISRAGSCHFSIKSDSSLQDGCGRVSSEMGQSGGRPSKRSKSLRGCQ